MNRKRILEVIIQKESNYLSYHYSKKKVIEIKKKYEDSQSLIYDWVILTRFDILICKKLDFSEIRENNFYLVGPRRHHGKRCKCGFCDETSENHCVSDLVFFSSSEKMDQFSKAYDFINEYGFKSNHIITKQHLVKTGLWENVDYYFTFIHNKYVHIWLLLTKVGLIPKGLVKVRVSDTNVPLVRWKTLSFGQKLLDLIIFKFKIDIIFYYLFVYPIGKLISIPYIKSILLYLKKRSTKSSFSD